jgi:hypothetical protein
MNENLKNRVFGVGYVESQPTVNHYHNGKVYRVVSLWAYRKFSKQGRKDYIRLYLSEEDFEKYSSIFKKGVAISFEGFLVKSKITETLSDVAVSLVKAEEVLCDSETGFKLTITGSVIKMNNALVTEKMTSQNFLILIDSDDESRVILKTTATDRMVDAIAAIEVSLGTRVEIKGTLLSYPVKNRDDLTAHLHDTRIVNLKKLGDTLE